MERQAKRLVEANLIDGVSKDEVSAADQQWSDSFAGAIEELQHGSVPHEQWPQHAHWDWKKKWAAIEGKLMYRMLGIEADGSMQGLMLVSTAGHYCRIDSQKGKPLVYINFVATAPWNSPGVVSQPKYALVGSIFVSAAIQLSVAEEFDGRIGDFRGFYPHTARTCSRVATEPARFSSLTGWGETPVAMRKACL